VKNVLKRPDPCLKEIEEEKRPTLLPLSCLKVILKFSFLRRKLLEYSMFQSGQFFHFAAPWKSDY